MSRPSHLAPALLAILALAGCAGPRAHTAWPTGKLDVHGVELHSDRDHRELAGVVATEEPCLHGYERQFESLDLVVGYGHDRRVRRISSFDPRTSMFGVHPGASTARARAALLEAGFVPTASPLVFHGHGARLTLREGEAGIVRGLVLERFDD